jgi:hypothetical protein
VSKVVLGSGVSYAELTEVRCVGTLIGLALIVALTRPASPTACTPRASHSSPAGITASLEPVCGHPGGLGWLGECFAPVQLSGAVLTLLGIFLAQTARRKSAAPCEIDLPLLGEATAGTPPQTAANAD